MLIIMFSILKKKIWYALINEKKNIVLAFYNLVKNYEMNLTNEIDSYFLQNNFYLCTS